MMKGYAITLHLRTNVSSLFQVAIDASMSIYQFLIAVRSEGNQLQNEAGETTSHLMGMFYRTIRMIDNGIKPVYVGNKAGCLCVVTLRLCAPLRAI